MDIVSLVKKQYGQIPPAIHYKDLCKILGKKTGQVFSLENQVLDLAQKLAKASPRKRFLILIHDDLKETVHRMINTLYKGTYAPPHKHINPNTTEDFIAIRGAAKLIEFEENGKIKNELAFGTGFKANFVEIKPGAIHTLVPLTDLFSCFEIKGQTSYSPKGDKLFFDWAPKEN
ncbi:MAG: WbuC family cupin fold metalloprotein [Patescibacteria group bacterium]